MYIADMNGDGMPDFLGSWNDGVWYWSSGQKTWHRMTSNSAEIVAAADLDGDGKADLIGNWAAQGGVWIKFSTSNNWVRVASDATWLYGGDMNGNGREDLLGNWAGGECYFEGQKEGSSSGVYMMDVKDMIWKRLVGPSQMIAAGDFDGDNTDDLIIKWTDDHVWLKLSNTGWKRLNASTGSKWLSAGHMRPAGGGSQLLWLEPETSLPSDAGIAGLAFDPIMTKDFIDLTEILPGGPMGESLEYITTEENLEVGLEIDRAMQKKFTNIIVEKEKKKKIIRK